MINLFNYLSNLNLINMKLKVPQVRALIIDYYTLSEFKENYLYDFIIDKNGNLKIGQGHYKLNNKEEYLYFAGRLKIKNNKIYYIDNDSGHFYPSEYELLKFVSEIKSSEYFENDLKYEFIELFPF